MQMSYYPICDACVEGIGEECHTPGCIFFFQPTPHNLRDIKLFGSDSHEVDEMTDEGKKDHRIKY